MGNIVRLAKSDVKRLFANVVSTVVTLGLVLLPSVFAWYNIIACWDVFDNTGNLTVAVANVDEGYESELVPLPVNVGEQVVSALRANDQIDWVFTTEDDAVDGARAGRYYAAVVIPPQFSRDMLTFYASDSGHASIVYYVNEKKNAIAPKITDQGADAVSYQVNQVFAQTLAEVSTGLVHAIGATADDAGLKDAASGLAERLRDGADEIDGCRTVASSYAALIGSLEGVLENADALAAATSERLGDTMDAAAGAASPLLSMGDEAKASVDAMDAALATSVQAYQGLLDSFDDLFGTAGQTADQAKSSLTTYAALLRDDADRYRDLAASLDDLKAGLPKVETTAGTHLVQAAMAQVDDATARILRAAAALDDVAESFDAAASKAADGSDALAAKRETAHQTLVDARDAMADAQQSFEAKAKPKLDDVAAKAGAAMDKTKALRDSLDVASAEASEAIGKAGGAVTATKDKLTAADGALSEVSAKLRDAADAMDTALATGDESALQAIIGSDLAKLSHALSAPVAVERVAVYPVENFGSAMAPLYTTLALYIGSLLILVVLKPAPSAAQRRELADPKPYQLYLGRFGVMAFLSLLQTTVMGLGNLLFLQVQAADPVLFMLVFWVAGLVFTFVIYTLVVSFANLGKAVAVILLIVQVTGCGGSYPLQILPGFIQAISPWLPATHVVDALREAMMGPCQNDYWIALGKLTLFVVPMLLLGLVLRKPLEKFMAWYVEKVESSKVVG
ncbi:YhgE/Pip domain-containing protein [Eggerthellaceae bacterium zg-893]|nr:YhgE/Pip domain-containing protein [Eggerthellaceae bacterium zg-893]